ncbi:GvpL/GvpF family gas vesicle protein [Micromonospora sp. NPDC047707]|uniref:GvpL/GvpF family gas vesicle protein n=1 Tax=Micromonospora sp. NPDC047707 TaxID=3154498 RepID=UPI00345437B5
MSEQNVQPTGETGLFVYGIVPSDVEPTPDAQGVGDPPGDVDVVRHGDLAALVSEVALEEPIGRPADLTAYERLLDGTAAVAPVLPVRFGTVVTGPDAVQDLLEAHHDRFAAALDEFEDRLQYTVHGRFDEQEVLSEILAADRRAADLATQVRGRPEAETREQRIRPHLAARPGRVRRRPRGAARRRAGRPGDRPAAGRIGVAARRVRRGA